MNSGRMHTRSDVEEVTCEIQRTKKHPLGKWEKEASKPGTLNASVLPQELSKSISVKGSQSQESRERLGVLCAVAKNPTVETNECSTSFATGRCFVHIANEMGSH